VARAVRAGVPREQVIVDPGIGFGKTAQHNLALLKALPRLTALDWPVLVGCSRKAFIGRIAAGGAEREPLGLTERFEGSLACAVWCMSCGVSVVRAHDVRATVEASRLVEATAEAMAAAGPGGGP
jgi:dihydropteroate synthase